MKKPRNQPALIAEIEDKIRTHGKWPELINDPFLLIRALQYIHRLRKYIDQLHVQKQKDGS